MYRSHVNNPVLWDAKARDCVVKWGSTYAIIQEVRLDRNGWIGEIDIYTERGLDSDTLQTITDRDKIEALTCRWMAEYNRDRQRAGDAPVNCRAYKNRYEAITLKDGVR